jgi:hypothetical protein
MRTRAPLAVLAASAALLVGCSDVVSGRGTTQISAVPSSALPSEVLPLPSDMPAPSDTLAPSDTVPSSGSSASGGPTTVATPCPHVTYPAAHLSFNCLTTGLVARARTDDDVWPLSARRTVEDSTGWVVEEGAGHWGPAQGHTLSDIAANVRQQMIEGLGYGVSPRFDTAANRAMTVSGRKARLLQTTITIAPAYAKQVGTKVRQEKLWIVAIQIAPGDVSLWYTSVPDLVSELWIDVPSIIASIRVI